MHIGISFSCPIMLNFLSYFLLEAILIGSLLLHILLLIFCQLRIGSVTASLQVMCYDKLCRSLSSQERKKFWFMWIFYPHWHVDRLESAYTNCIPSAHSFEIDKVTTLVRIRSKTSQKPLRKSMYKCELVHYFEGPPICIFTHLWSIIFNSLFFLVMLILLLVQLRPYLVTIMTIL